MCDLFHTIVGTQREDDDMIVPFAVHTFVSLDGARDSLSGLFKALAIVGTPARPLLLDQQPEDATESDTPGATTYLCGPDLLVYCGPCPEASHSLGCSTPCPRNTVEAIHHHYNVSDPREHNAVFDYLCKEDERPGYRCEYESPL